MILLLVFVIAPLIELYVAIQVGHWLGALNTIGLLILFAVVGVAVVKREGLKVWNRFVTQVQAGQVPTREIADGVSVLLAGALLIAPGFVSDALGLLLLFPPTRALFRRYLMRRKSLGGLRRTRVIRATYGGRIVTDVTDVTDATSHEPRRELDP